MPIKLNVSFPFPSLVVRNCTGTPTAMGAALQFLGTTVNRLDGYGVADPIQYCGFSIKVKGPEARIRRGDFDGVGSHGI